MNLMSHNEVSAFIADMRKMINSKLDEIQDILDAKFDKEMSELEEYYSSEEKLSEL